VNIHVIRMTLKHIATSAIMLLQQDHDIGETETDVLKQMGVVVDRVRTVCAKYKLLTTPAAASKDDTTCSAAPVPQQQQLRLVHAAEKLKTHFVRDFAPLREHELAAARSLLTEATAGNTRASVNLRGPAGSGKGATIARLRPQVLEWCRQHAKSQPISIQLLCTDRPAGLYSAILQKLNITHPEIGDVSEIVVEAREQLQALLFTDNHDSSSTSSNVPMIVLLLFAHSIAASHTDELKQLFEWTHTAGCRLVFITTSKTDLTRMLPGLQ
jgi:hypothetical protein